MANFALKKMLLYKLLNESLNINFPSVIAPLSRLEDAYLTSLIYIRNVYGIL